MKETKNKLLKWMLYRNKEDYRGKKDESVTFQWRV